MAMQICRNGCKKRIECIIYFHFIYFIPICNWSFQLFLQLLIWACPPQLMNKDPVPKNGGLHGCSHAPRQGVLETRSGIKDQEQTRSGSIHGQPSTPFEGIYTVIHFTAPQLLADWHLPVWDLPAIVRQLHFQRLFSCWRKIRCLLPEMMVWPHKLNVNQITHNRGFPILHTHIARRWWTNNWWTSRMP